VRRFACPPRRSDASEVKNAIATHDDVARRLKAAGQRRYAVPYWSRRAVPYRAGYAPAVLAFTQPPVFT